MTHPLWPAIAILAFVTLQRLSELGIARANTARLIAEGAREVAPGHYPLIVAIHTLWLLCLWFFALGRSISIPLLLLFALLQMGRIWVLRTLGPRWTTRIIVLPGAPLVFGGPFRFVRHPNYVVVAGEIIVLPMVFGLWWIALLFTALNAVAMVIRIRAEDAALAPQRD